MNIELLELDLHEVRKKIKSLVADQQNLLDRANELRHLRGQMRESIRARAQAEALSRVIGELREQEQQIERAIERGRAMA